MRFVGYSLAQKGYRLYDENKRKIFIRREYNWRSKNRMMSALRKNQLRGNHLICSAQERKPPVYYHDEYAGITTAKHTGLFVTEVEELTTLKKALESDHAENWKAAADPEYQSLLENETWELVELPPGRKAITWRRVFKVKHDENGKVKRCKGCLVAKGFLQKFEVEFDETFSPVIHFTSV